MPPRSRRPPRPRGKAVLHLRCLTIWTTIYLFDTLHTPS
ncbi:hypothetical protein [Azospirillum argentinense]